MRKWEPPEQHRKWSGDPPNFLSARLKARRAFQASVALSHLEKDHGDNFVKKHANRANRRNHRSRREAVSDHVANLPTHIK
eukprot:scaffold12782_cov129-Isochrysis_galbana.AAC.5